MKVIGYLGSVDRLFGMPVTTRNWNTVCKVAAVLVNNHRSFSHRGSSPK
jgi:NADH:ubiquinone oxidoreductase subunit F (NADH-binding)